MKNKNLTLDLIEKMGENSLIEMIIEKSTLLSLSIQNLKKIEHKEDHIAYRDSYNEVCERIADMRVMIEQAEFLFNTNEINNHYENKIKHLQKSLNEF